MDNDIKVALIQKLMDAQVLLSDVYHNAIDVSNNQVESLMSVADSCINEAIDALTIKG